MSTGIKHTVDEKRNVINHIFGLVRSGANITKARKTVSKEIGVTSHTLWNWQNTFKMKTPTVIKTKDLVKNSGVRAATRTVTKSSSNAIEGLENMKGKLGIVFTSLVNQDGRFTNQDATAISGTASVILGCCKQVLLERKAINKISK